MSRVSYLQDLLSSIFERGAHLTGLVSAPDQQASITTLCHDLLSMRGEASGTRVAGDSLNLYRPLDGAQKTAFFHLGDLVEFDDTEKVFTNPTDSRTQDYITGRFG